jgi:aminoglycoside N3'-acetyltransferase
MNELFAKFLNCVDRNRIYNEVENLWRKEFPQTSRAYLAAAEYTLELLREAGMENVEMISFPADGKTVYQDKCMPLAWDATIGKLTIRKSPRPFAEPVIADYQRHPFHLVKGSAAIPEGKRLVKIITETQLFAGEDADGALVVCAPSTVPGAAILKTALDLGAIGLISDYYAQACRVQAPEAIGWVNAGTEGANWHVIEGDRPFVCFSITAGAGDQLRQAAEVGEVTALVECDGRRYQGSIPGVTALIPGRQKKEFWLMAHLYEPLSDDNSTGVVAAIEMVRCIKELIAKGDLPELEFSLRLVFGAEMYGFAAFAEHFGGNLSERTIGAVNLDSLMAGNPNQRLHVYAAAPGTPFFGNALLEIFLDQWKDKNAFPVAKFAESGWYDDDTLLTDRTVGLPTVWFIGREKMFWHNSALTMQLIDRRIFARICATIGTWIASVVTLNKASLAQIVRQAGAYGLSHLAIEYRNILQKGLSADEGSEQLLYRLQRDCERLEDFREVGSDPEIERQIELLQAATKGYLAQIKEQAPVTEERKGKWFDYSATVLASRVERGFPHDQTRLPRCQRRSLPDGVIYGPFSRVLSNMDGQKTLQRVIREAEWEEGTVFSETKIKEYLGAVMFLGKHGFLKVEYNQKITHADILSALQNVGVRSGDCLFVHSSASAFGWIEGGETAVIEAFLEAIGSTGTLLMPTFTSPFNSFEGTLNKGRRYRPFDPEDPSQVRVGSIPRTFLQMPGVIRSRHPSHPVAGIGSLAAACLEAQQENDPPTGETSSFAKLVEYKGRLVYFGCGLAPSTFLHYLETVADLPYLKDSVCRVKNKDGSLRTVYIPKNLPGDRDFYRDVDGNSKFFKKALASGLKMNESTLGCGKIRLLEAENFYAVGMKLLSQDPNILLCDNEECLFCRKYKQ